MVNNRLKREFFERDTLIVAKELLGKTLIRVTDEGTVKARIVETEAYLGEADDAAHTYKGKSERTRVAYGEKGLAYIYLIYGMYCCFNITSGECGKPEMVLIRALEPISGEELMKKRRAKAKKREDLANGPGKLCRALAVDRALYGEDLITSERFYITDGAIEGEAGVGARKNINYAERCKDEPWRFFIKNNKYISK